MERLILILFAIFTVLSSQSQVSWRIDNTHGHFGFSIKYMALSDYEGRFKMYDGKIQSKSETDFTDAVFNILIDINSISAVVEGHEDLLKSEDFFDVKNFPIATFRSTSMKPRAIQGTYDLVGNLTIRGITKEVELIAVAASKPVMNPHSNQINYALKITGAIKRSDYGVGSYELMDFGELVLSDKVQIGCSLILQKSDKNIPMVKNTQARADEAKLISYTGQYDYGNGAILSVSKEQGRLFIKKTGSYKKELFLLMDNKFIYEFNEVEIDFVSNNNTAKLIVIAGNQKTDALKISDSPEIESLNQQVKEISRQYNYIDKSWDALLRKSYAEAIEYSLAGLELSPDDLSLKINLAHAYLFSGDQVKALKCYKDNMNKKTENTIPFSSLIQQDFMFFKSRQFSIELLDKMYAGLRLIPNDAYQAMR